MPVPEGLAGERLRSAWADAAAHLRERAAAIDAINEYPVPDGDTGSNMSATLDRAIEAAAELPPEAGAGAMLAAMARGALYGARGNSGVILSQALRGLAAGVGDRATIDAATLALGMTRAAEAAYSAVAEPAEGTMLTVLRVGAERATAAAAALPDGGNTQDGARCLAVFREATAAAEQAQAETIDQLPELQAAGVPDAGGEGVCTILRGLLASFTGQRPVVRALPARSIVATPEHTVEAFGYCTEFLIEGDGQVIDVAEVRELAAAKGATSVVVVGDTNLVRVHAHSEAPQALLDAAAGLGRLSRVKVEDMAAQHQQLVATGSGAGVRTALLALSHGSGFDRIFASLGAVVAPLGEMTRPPAGDIAAAADRLNQADVIVLPNHRNVLMAARQAAGLARSTLHIVPSAGLPQGIAAALAYNPNAGPAENLAAMTAALGTVRSIEVTVAAADRTAAGIAIRAGQAIAFADGTLVAATDTLEQALTAALEAGGATASGLITLYGGADIPAETLEGARELVASAFLRVEVEAVAGGQPLYPYIASIED